MNDKENKEKTKNSVLLNIPEDLNKNLEYLIKLGAFKNKPEIISMAFMTVGIYLGSENGDGAFDGIQMQKEDTQDKNIDYFRNYIFLDHSLVKAYGRKETKYNIMVNVPDFLLDEFRKLIKKRYEYDDISSKDLLKYSLSIFVYGIYSFVNPGIKRYTYYSYANYPEVEEKRFPDVLLDNNYLSDYKPSDNMFIGSRGTAKCFVDGKEYVQKKTIKNS